MNGTRKLVLALALTSSLVPSASAQELRVSAPVVSVEPIMTEQEPICDVDAPPRDAGLAAALRWDLRGRCRDSQAPPVVTGYAVEYEWDGRRFTTVMSTPPQGDRLALRLKID